MPLPPPISTVKNIGFHCGLVVAYPLPSEDTAMNPKMFWLITAILLALSLRAESQQPKKMARIGYLSAYSGPHPALAAFKDELRGLGWIEGKNITFEYRYGGGQGDKYSDFATELVRLNVDVIVAGPGNGAPRAAKRVTETIPIVMVAVSTL